MVEWSLCRALGPPAERRPVRVDARSRDRVRRPLLRPAQAELEQYQRADEERGGETDQADRVRPSQVLDRAEHRGKEEAAEPAGGADDPGHDAHAAGKTLRYQLE